MIWRPTAGCRRARFRPGRGRAAARSGAWRSVDQCGDGARRRRQRKPDGARRADRRRLRRTRARSRGDYRGSGFTVAPAKPGFINIRLAPEVWHAQLRAILRAGTAFGDSAIGGGEPVNVEFVSANPTGPMHVGHGRGAVVGDALAGAAGQGRATASQREYYINDAGAQVDVARALGLPALPRGAGRSDRAIPAGLYPGEYLPKPAARSPSATARKWLGRPEAEWLQPVRDFAVAQMMALIRDDLAALGRRITIVFVSERALIEGGRDRRVPGRARASGG